MANTLYVNTFIPDWGKGLADYSPWVIGHTNVENLEQSVIQNLFDKFAKEEGYEIPEIMNTFYDYLADKGYTIFRMYNDPIILDTKKQKKRYIVTIDVLIDAAIDEDDASEQAIEKFHDNTIGQEWIKSVEKVKEE
jgi:hypothetical protein